MAKKVKAFTKNYNGEPIREGEVMIPFEYTEGDKENCTNPECIKTLKQGGKNFKVVYKAVPEKWAKVGTSALSLIENEELGHYMVPNSISMDEVKDEYSLELGSIPSVEEAVIQKETLKESIELFYEKMLLLINKAPKIGYAVLLMFHGSKGSEFAEKLRLKHDGANKVRQVAEKLLVDGLIHMDIDLVACKKNHYTEVYRQEALVLLEEIVAKF